MKHVSIASIEKAIAKIDNLDEDGLERISETFALANPVLLSYVMQAATEYENEQLEGLLIYYFSLIVEAFQQEGITVLNVTEQDIDDNEEPFFDALEAYFDSENLEEFQEFVDQPDLIQFMMMEISTPDVDGTELDDETATQLFIVTSAMINVMTKVTNA